MSNSGSSTLLGPNGFQPSFFSLWGQASTRRRVTQIGRYRLDSLIAVGGMGSIHFGVLTGAAEFSRLVAIKRLHPHLAEDPHFRVRFIEEARLNARILHPNVVQLLDVVEAEDELWLIMEYVDGETLQCLHGEVTAAGRLLPLDVVAGVIGGVLEGLYAAHETTDASGAPLRIVHRDISPQNIMISRCGQVKVIDFGIAKATVPAAVSTLGHLVGKVSYMSPEQARGIAVDQRSDVFATGVVLWETLTGRRLFREGEQSHTSIVRDVLRKPVPAPSTYRAEIPSKLDAVVLRALARNPRDRFGSAREFARALDAAVPLAPGSKISAYVTVFCEARTPPRGPAHALPLAEAPPPKTTVAGVQTDHEDCTSLELTAVFKPLRHVASSRPSSLRRFGRYAFPLALVICAAAAVRWATRFRNSIAEPSTEVSTLGSPSEGLVRAPARPTASFGAPPASVTPQPAATPALREVLAFPELHKITKQRTPPLVTSPSSASKQTAKASKPPATASRQAASARPLLPGHDDCSVPTYLGQDGIQHFKVQCL